MDTTLEQLSLEGRRAVGARNWRAVGACASEILRLDRRSAEGHFLSGLVEKAGRRSTGALAAFSRALELDAGRYDSAIELAAVLTEMGQYPQAADLLRRYESHLANSPRYLDMAGLAYGRLGLHDRAWPLHRRANELQPGVPSLLANLAACSVYVGRIEDAKAIYKALLEKAPTHQRNHYELSQLGRARDSTHVDQMWRVLEETRLPAERNIFLYYAIGKELEDLGRWDEAFDYYKLAGETVMSVADYDLADDLAVIDKIIEVCTAGWLSTGNATSGRKDGKTPIFVVGLPRTGTTLVDRILSSHSQVQSIGETFSMPVVLRRISGVVTTGGMSPAVIEGAAGQDMNRVARSYMEAVSYRLGDQPFFVEKLPENFLYLGFIARAWPDARIVYLRRDPMDTCFALYKQSFFKFAYTLANVGHYFLAHERLSRHWMQVLGKRLVDVRYETLVADQESQTRLLLDRLGLPFEPACLEFERNESVIATASSAQVREKIHSRSVGRWKSFEKHLRPLRKILEDGGIAVD